MRMPRVATVVLVCGLGLASTLGACTSDDEPKEADSAAPATGASVTPSAGPESDISTATIVAPAQDVTVPQCAIVSGTSVLAPQKTLVSAMINLDNGDPLRYYEPVTNWQVPAQLVNWTAKQYFGSGDTSVGQRFAVEIFSADLAVVTAAFKKAKESGKGWASEDPPAGGKMVARVQVKRVAGKGPDACN
jgi:serine/threonine-protein kinase